MRLLYDTIRDNLLLIIVLVFFGTMALLSMPPPRDDTNIIRIEIELDKIDGSLKSIEETIEEIFSKLEKE
tara:strand:+ start:301 stop:510 length:210 start_codon:yes stop_codon:yes gene_type:complete